MTENLRPFWLALLLLSVALGAAAPAGAREPNVNPGINTHYQDPRWERWVAIFERDGREVYDRRHDIMAALAVEPGATVADIGAGTGLFTRLFAEAVGARGRVYAVDISPTFVENTVRSAEAKGFANVTGVVNSPREVMLPEGSIDLAFISDTYHHFEYPLTTMASIHSALRPGGEVVVIDFKREADRSSPWVMGHVRAGKQEFVDEIESVGFRLKEDRDFMETQYFLRFVKE